VIVPIPPIVLRDAERKLAVFCRRHSLALVADKLRYEFSHARYDVFLLERRPDFRGSGAWSNLTVARFRYNQTRDEWALYWADRNEKWHRFSGISGTSDINELLAVVDADPTGIFWG
jgi:hypothetical protein